MSSRGRSGTGSASPDIKLQVSQIGLELERRAEDIGRAIAGLIRETISFYRETRVVSDDDLVRSCTDNVHFLCAGLQLGQSFDTSPAVTLGARRAASGVPLPAIMDGYRVGLRYVWDTVSELVSAQAARFGTAALAAATERVWQAQDVFTDAMAGAYRQQAMHEVLDHEAERAALIEALLEGRVFDPRSLWEIAQLLRLPQRGPYVVIAAAAPAVGKAALRGITNN